MSYNYDIISRVVMIMDSIIEKLFDTYGEAVLREMGHGFDERQLEKWLGKFPIDEKTRYQILDGLFDYYRHWAAASFAAGFHLGLSLLYNEIRRSRPEKV